MIVTAMIQIPNKLKRFFQFLVKHEVIILLLFLQLFLRVPNLFEPYWYGDEGIYLTVGNAMKDGSRLYAEIIDHKTPLIYYFAMVPSQFWFRMLTIAWMSVSTLLFYKITQKFKLPQLFQYIATFVFIMYTTLPWLEGNIPNGELFVMGFTLAGLWLFTLTDIFEEFIQPSKKKSVQFSSKDLKLTFLAGILFGLGILTKVPGLFEIVPVGVVGLYLFVNYFKLNSPTIFRNAKHTVTFWITLLAGTIFPIILSILYFYLRGSLNDYINFGLLYNFRYAGHWSLPFSQPWLVFAFSLPGKFLILTFFVLLTLIFTKVLKPQTKFLAVWTLASLFAAILSSRPYPHYMLQVVPPLSLLFGYIFSLVKVEKSTKTLFNAIFGALIFVIFYFAYTLLEFHPYPVRPYYRNFFEYISRRIDQPEYFNRFNGLMTENYEIAPILKSSPKRIFIWGTNPVLYALAHQAPTGRFTVSFHIKDFEGAFEETYQSIVNVEPEYIVVMKNEDGEFTKFYEYLDQNYLLYKDSQHMTVYRKTSINLQ